MQVATWNDAWHYAIESLVTKPNEPKFQAETYREHRPFYPQILFKPLRDLGSSPDRFLDLGCGAGQSLTSFVNFLSESERAGDQTEGYAIDPDEKMLVIAEQDYRANVINRFKPPIQFIKGSAEGIPLASSSVDAVLVGSAFHWFSRKTAFSEITRVTHPNGWLFVFEYQFPKCINDPTLHEAVRRRFNLEWKAPVQSPRGTLADLTADFRSSDEWRLLSSDRPIWRERLSLAEFLGHLFSQSRYLHAEAKQADPEAYREDIRASLFSHFSGGPLHFDLKPSSFLFQRVLR